MTTHPDTTGVRTVLSKKGHKNPVLIPVDAVKLSRFKKIYQQAVSFELQLQLADIGQSLKERFLVWNRPAHDAHDLIHLCQRVFVHAAEEPRLIPFMEGDGGAGVGGTEPPTQ